MSNLAIAAAAQTALAASQSWIPETQFGLDKGNPGDFGGGDYIAALRARPEGTTPAEQRQQIIDWLRDTSSYGGYQHLWAGNREGAGTPGHPNYREDAPAITLMDRIIGSGSPNRDINTEWREYDEAGNIIADSEHKFSDADFLATRAMAYPGVQIKSYLDQNPDLLGAADKEGVGGGVYQRVMANIRKSYGDPQFDISRGNDPKSFGGADYAHALKVSGDVNATRREVLNWLRDQPYWLTRANEPGSPLGEGYGLFDRIEGKGWDQGSGARDINTFWGDYEADPDAGKFFTHDDLRATRALGFGDKEIQEWLDEAEAKALVDEDTPSVLRAAHKKGVEGGVYASLDIGPQMTETPFSDFTTRSRDFSTPDTESGIDPRPGRSSLTIGTRKPFTARRATTAYSAKRTRKKVRQTKDLRRSLNIS